MIRRVVIFFLIYLPLQYALIGICGYVMSEPWPTFALPGFKNVYSTEGQATVVKPFFYAEMRNSLGEYHETKISEYELFDGLQKSQVQGFIRTHFSEPKEFSREARQWLQDQVEQINPDYEGTGLKVIWREIVYEPGKDDVQIVPGDDIKVIEISFGDTE